MMPFAEQSALLHCEKILKKKYPDAKIISIHSGTTGDGGDQSQKTANIKLVKEIKYDFVLYTGSCDCGVSFPLEYDVVICKLNVRSIAAGVVMQMLHRCRNVKDKHFIIVQDNRCVNYENHPGYISEKYAPGEGTEVCHEKLSEITSVAKVLTYLKCNGEDDECTWCNAKGIFYTFTRREKPRETTLAMAMEILTSPCKMNCNARNAVTEGESLTVKQMTTMNQEYWGKSDERLSRVARNVRTYVASQNEH